VQGPEEAEEAVQRTLGGAARSVHRFDSRRGRFRDWLNGICRTEAIIVLGGLTGPLLSLYNARVTRTA